MSRAEERFWKKVNKNGPVRREDLGQCWEWIGGRNPDGYGVFYTGQDCFRAHRFSWYLAHGAMPANCACHHCDNPACVNPAHLYDGTMAENCSDRDSRGRAAPGHIRSRNIQGAKQHMAKLTDEMVREMRAKYAAGAANQYELSQEFGIGQANVSRILNRKMWRHVA